MEHLNLININPLKNMKEPIIKARHYSNVTICKLHNKRVMAFKNNKEDILKKQKERYQRKEKTMSIRRLNGHAYIHYKAAICEGLNIDNADLYKAIISIDNNGVIETKDNKKYILKLTEIK